MALRSIFKKRKANVALDSVFYFIAVIIFIVITITGSYVLDQVNDDVQADPDMDNVSKVELQNLTTNMPTWFDYGAATVLLLLWVLVIVASFNIDTHPIFFMISVFVLMLAIFAINQFMTAISDYFAEPEISPITTLYPISMFIVNNVEKIIAFVGFTILISLYAKYKA